MCIFRSLLKQHTFSPEPLDIAAKEKCYQMFHIVPFVEGGGEMDRVEVLYKDGNNSGSEGIQNVKNLKKNFF